MVVALLAGMGCSSEQNLGKETLGDPPLEGTTTTSTTEGGGGDFDWHDGFDPTPDPEDPQTEEDDPFDPFDPSSNDDPEDGGDPGDFDDPPQRDRPPSETIEEDPCDDGLIATVDASELMVGSHGPLMETTTVDAPVSGWFDLYNEHIVESGSGQWNETAYFRVTNGTNPAGEPLLSNCGTDWIVRDLDNYGPIAGTRTYIGTFWLDAGAGNTLEMHHYCERYRNGECPSFHFTDDPGSTCDADNVNSVHFFGEGLCLLVPE
jgi:hypothetical protein